MVLSETRHEAGLLLFQVLRGGLTFKECLGKTAGRANHANETAPRTHVPDPRATGEENDPAPRTSGSGHQRVGKVK